MVELEGYPVALSYIKLSFPSSREFRKDFRIEEPRSKQWGALSVTVQPITGSVPSDGDQFPGIIPADGVHFHLRQSRGLELPEISGRLDQGKIRPEKDFLDTDNVDGVSVNVRIIQKWGCCRVQPDILQGLFDLFFQKPVEENAPTPVGQHDLIVRKSFDNIVYLGQGVL